MDKVNIDKKGIQIWTVRRFRCKRWPREKYGTFCGSDVYIVLNTKIKSNNVKYYHVFIWLGYAITQDEVIPNVFVYVYSVIW